MGIEKRLILSLCLFCLTVLPSSAFFDGKISKGHIYDVDTTIMSQFPVAKEMKNEEYWTKNIFYFNKYRPLFMLSNKDLYDLIPRENVAVMQKFTTPSVYNISLKSSSISSVSFKPVVNANFSSPEKAVKKPVVKVIKQKSELVCRYEQAKNPGVDSEDKIQTAILLKNSKNPANYNMAFDLLNDVIKKEPYNAYAFYLKGELYAQKKDSANAIKNYVEALKINPLSKQTCFGIAKVLEPTNKTLALKYYQKAQND